VGHPKESVTSVPSKWLTLMSEYTHNDDVADLLYAKEQEVEFLKKAVVRLSAELDRLEKEHARGV
jgi:hypothetical protein